MTTDALYLYDLFRIQRDVLKYELMESVMRNSRFDKFSYGSWSIQETLNAIDAYEGDVSVGVIRNILKIQMTEFDRYYSSDNTYQERYKYALETITELYKMTGGYVYEQ